MKFATENELCKEVTPLILGLLYGEGGVYKAVAEVPLLLAGYIDLVVFNMKNKTVLGIEYKLNNESKLRQQVGTNPIKSIGIINTPRKWGEYENELFSYTGLDSELEKFSQIIIRSNILNRWSSIYDNSYASIYYWGYLEQESNFEDGGKKYCHRDALYDIYKRAIKNLINHYGDIDFYAIYRMLGVYAPSTAKTYYNEIKKSLT